MPKTHPTYDEAFRRTFRAAFTHGNPVHILNQRARSKLNKEHIGFVFQQFHLLDLFNIVSKKDLYPSQLSGGQQQLVAIARAVISKPSLILADEPTGNLHTDQGKEIMDLFAKLNDKGTTIVQVTHSKENAARGNRFIQLRDGWMDKE